MAILDICSECKRKGGFANKATDKNCARCNLKRKLNKGSKKEETKE